MNNVADKERISELREILEMADLVKFAKLAPAMNENDRNLMAAVEFIEKTKNVEEETRPQPTEKKIISKRSVRQKWALIISVVVLALLLVAVAVFLYFDLSNLFG